MKIARRIASHSVLAVLEAGLVAALVVGLMAGTAVAGKGGPAGGTAISVSMVADANGNGAPNHRDVVTFSFSTSADRPTISLTCAQNGVTVYGDSRPMYEPNIWDDEGNFTLSSLSWTSGSATCKATLKAQAGRKISTLGTLTFAVGS